MAFDIDDDFGDYVLSFDESFQKFIQDRDYDSALEILNKLLFDEKKQYENIKSLLGNLINNSTDGDVYEIGEIENTYYLLGICSEKIKKFEKVIEQINLFKKLDSENI